MFCPKINQYAPISSAIRMEGGAVVSRQHTDKKNPGLEQLNDMVNTTEQICARARE